MLLFAGVGKGTLFENMDFRSSFHHEFLCLNVLQCHMGSGQKENLVFVGVGGMKCYLRKVDLFLKWSLCFDHWTGQVSGLDFFLIMYLSIIIV